jgi:hypothetical protein
MVVVAKVDIPENDFLCFDYRGNFFRAYPPRTLTPRGYVSILCNCGPQGLCKVDWVHSRDVTSREQKRSHGGIQMVVALGVGRVLPLSLSKPPFVRMASSTVEVVALAESKSLSLPVLTFDGTVQNSPVACESLDSPACSQSWARYVTPTRYHAAPISSI